MRYGLFILFCGMALWQIYLWTVFRIPEKRKVLHVLLYLRIGGLEKLVVNLATHSKKLNVFPELFVFDEPNPDRNLLQQLESKGIPVHCSIRGHGFSFLTVYKLATVCLKNKIQIMHTHDLSALIYGVFAKLLLFPYVHLVHTQHSFIHLLDNPRYRRYEKIFTTFTDTLCVLTPSMQQTYANLGVRKRIEIIGNGVDYPPDMPTPELKQSAKIKIVQGSSGVQALNPQKKWIVNLARLHKEKGQRELIGVWSRLPRELKNQFQLIFVGNESHLGFTSTLETEVSFEDRQSQSIIFAGPTSHPDQWCLAADLLISASRIEGFPLAPIEGLAGGASLLLSKINGHLMFCDLASYFVIDSADRMLEQIQANLMTQSETPCNLTYDQWSAAKEGWSSERMVNEYHRWYN